MLSALGTSIPALGWLAVSCLDNRSVICPALHLKKEESDSSQPDGKKHTGGLCDLRVGILGYRQGCDMRDL